MTSCKNMSEWWNWQTRQTQNLIWVTMCGFKSHFRHQLDFMRTRCVRFLLFLCYNKYQYFVGGGYMELIINEDNLELKEIQEFNSKVRALLIDENNNILIANYGNTFLLPGGSIDQGEATEEAIIRELKEEIGIDYNLYELTYLNTLKYYQNNYPKRDGNLQNRLITTYYFVGRYKGISNQTLTEKERKDNFRLQLVSIDELEELVLNNQNNNPRNIYFVKELLTILEYYKQSYPKTSVKKRILN